VVDLSEKGLQESIPEFFLTAHLPDVNPQRLWRGLPGPLSSQLALRQVHQAGLATAPAAKDADRQRGVGIDRLAGQDGGIIPEAESILVVLLDLGIGPGGFDGNRQGSATGEELADPTAEPG